MSFLSRLQSLSQAMAATSYQPDSTSMGLYDADKLGRMPVLSDTALEHFHNPPKALQERFVGSAFQNAYKEAVEFLNHMLERTYTLQRLEGLRILDLGCGWGRMLRLLRHRQELDKTYLYGADPQELVLDICQRSIPRVCLSQVQAFPPTDFRDSLFDLVYAYSVFSHLSQESHLAWATEIHRITRPGGFVCFTLQNRYFIQFCRNFRTGADEVQSQWHEELSKSFTEPDVESRYDAGEFLFSATTSSSSQLNHGKYGEAVVPQPFIEQNWGELGFDLIDWWDHPEPQYGGQNRILLRKR